ncbi:unnamed protein product [Acanthoscelides obtectus]|uniref:Uncharacterized protein n=1 Tax=Acanthoscelides obtectus TaxID=200917 RepID=A0A9P0JZZ0_ACAOB|nr:unnamed protein product [Acanthoscelides obtectus]CAK1640819.1 hypothetical protein AOBTE_LOCUS11948 [Acanthoscelides obtectus]
MICPCCNITLLKNRMTTHTRTLQHRTKSAVPMSDGVRLIYSAFRCRIASYRFSATDAYINFQDFFRNIQQNVLDVIEEKLLVYKALKVNMEVFGKYVLQSKYVDTTNKVIDMGVDLPIVYKHFTDEIISQSSEFDEKDSGWAIETVLFAEVYINKFSPFGGPSFIKLPHFIEKKKAIINV